MSLFPLMTQPAPDAEGERRRRVQAIPFAIPEVTMKMIDFDKLNVSVREAMNFRPPTRIDEETAQRTWTVARLLDSWADIMTDGPDDSDAQMAQRFLEAAVKLARELRPA